MPFSLPFPLARRLLEFLYPFVVHNSPQSPIKRNIQKPTREAQTAYDDLLDAALTQDNRIIEYHLPYPKHEFLNYVCDLRGLVAHGSPLKDITTLQPIRLTSDRHEFGNREQIFCSPDGVWAMWFAILDKSQIRLTDNSCIRLGRGDNRIKYYHFSLSKENESDPPFTEGMVYLAKAEDFPDHRQIRSLEVFDAAVEEWGSTKVVTPIAQLPVSPKDFPYLDKVQFDV